MKKFTAMVLAAVTALSFSACSGGKSESVILEGKIGKDTVTATVTCSAGTVAEEKEFDSSRVLSNKKDMFEMDIAINTDNEYEANKEYVSGEEGFKEIKVGSYDGYAYKYSDFEYEVNIYLKKIEDTDVYVTAYLTSTSPDLTLDIDDLYNSESVQNILKSVEYTGEKAVEEKTAD